MQWLAEEFVTGNATHDATRLVQDLPIMTEQSSALFLSFADGQSLAADHAIRQFQGLFPSSVLIHDGRDHATEITEVEFAALEGHDLHAGVTQLLPMHHRIENIFTGHAALFREQHGTKRTAFASVNSF
jgi:hypothetical protein